MKKHTTLGYQTLSWAEKRMGGHNDFLRLGAVIAYTHHERWDGKGRTAADARTAWPGMRSASGPRWWLWPTSMTR